MVYRFSEWSFFFCHSWKLPESFLSVLEHLKGYFESRFLSMIKIRWLKEYIKIAKEAKHDKDWLVSSEHKVVLPRFAIRRSNQPKFERRWWFHRRICRFCGSPNFIVTISSYLWRKFKPWARKMRESSAKAAFWWMVAKVPAKGGSDWHSWILFSQLCIM